MVTGNVVEINEVIDVSNQLLQQVGQIGLWLQTLGLIVILWIIFQIVSFFINRERMKEVLAIKQDMDRIEKKIDSILKSHEKTKRIR